MPRMNQPRADLTLAKLLLVGDGKIGKTWYAAMAAKQGFRVLYLDGEVGSQTISKMLADGVLTSEEASRIYLLNIADTTQSGMRDTKMVEFMNEFTSSSVIRWNDTDQKLGRRSDTDKELWEIRPGLMGPNDVIILDSWTAFTESTMLWAGRANGVDIYSDETHKLRPAYQGAGLKATELCTIIQKAPSHWIVLAHTDEYQHTTVKEGTNKGTVKEKDQVVDWTKMIPRSTSKPHGFQMPKYFTDMAWMALSPSGSERRLDFRPQNDRVGGGHFSGFENTEKYSFLNLVRSMLPDFTPDPNAPMDWLKIIMPGESTTEAAPVLDGTKPKTISGLAAFAKK